MAPNCMIDAQHGSTTSLCSRRHQLFCKVARPAPRFFIMPKHAVTTDETMTEKDQGEDSSNDTKLNSSPPVASVSTAITFSARNSMSAGRRVLQRIPGFRLLPFLKEEKPKHPDPTPLAAIGDRYLAKGKELARIMDDEGVVSRKKDPSRDVHVLMQDARLGMAVTPLADGDRLVIRSPAAIQDMFHKDLDYTLPSGMGHIGTVYGTRQDTRSLLQDYLQGGLTPETLQSIFISAQQAGALLSARSGIVDVQGFAEDVTFDLLSRAFAGAEIGVLAPGAEGRTETAEKLLVAWRTVINGTGSAHKPAGFDRAMEDLESWIYDVIERRTAAGPKTTPPSTDLISFLLWARKGSGDALEYRKIAIEMLGAMIPAGDIVSHTVAWTLLMLANRPTKAQRAAREAGRMLEPTGIATKDALARVPFLTCCVLETLRLHPSARAYPLECAKGALLDGHTVPKGTQCLPSVYLLHRNSDAWGPRAADWVPERWFAGAETDLAPRGEGPAVFVPFGSRTSRALVGQEVAMPAVRAILAHVLSHCDVGTAGDDRDAVREIGQRNRAELASEAGATGAAQPGGARMMLHVA